jgi:TatD DNase family protein
VTSGPTRRRAAEQQTGHSRDRTLPPEPDPLPYPVVDNHCHLDIADGERWFSVEEALAAGARVGVPRIVNVGCDLTGARWAVDVASAHPEVVAAVSLHPNEASRLATAGRLDDALGEIERLATGNDRVRAIGETGLDHYRTGPEGRPAQEESFRAHIALAKQLDKALVIHDRDAHADVLRVLDEQGVPDRTVMHCFSGDADFARECLQRGMWLSFAGTVTFKNADPLRAALRATPSERLLVETDAPFLTPMPYRGRPNASFLVPHTMRAMAASRETDLDELCRSVEAATFEAFGGTW